MISKRARRDMAIITTTTEEAVEEERAAKQEKREKIRHNLYDTRKRNKEKRSRKRVRPMF